MNKERCHWIDIAKGFFILAIVQGHILSNKDNLITWWLFSFHVPAFFFLSGLCFHVGDEGFLAFLKKKVRTILIPYLLASILSIVLFALAGIVIPRIHDFVDPPANNLVAMLYSNSNLLSMKYNLPLWFLPCLFSVEIMGYGIWWMIEKLGRQKLFLLLATALSILATVSFRLNLPLHTETACAMLFWFLIGTALRKSRLLSLDFGLPGKWWIAASFALILLGAGISFLNTQNLNIRRNQYGAYWNYYLCAFLGVAGFCLLSIGIRKNRFLEYLGRNTLVILMFHKFPILVFQDLIPTTGKYLDATISVTGTVVSVLVLAITIAFCLVTGVFLDRYLPWFLGKRTKPK